GVLKLPGSRILRFAHRSLDVSMHVERDDRVDIDPSARHTRIPCTLLTASSALRTISSMSWYSGTAMPRCAAGRFAIASIHRSRCGRPSIDTPDHLYVRTHGQ